MKPNGCRESERGAGRRLEGAAIVDVAGRAEALADLAASAGVRNMGEVFREAAANAKPDAAVRARSAPSVACLGAAGFARKRPAEAQARDVAPQVALQAAAAQRA